VLITLVAQAEVPASSIQLIKEFVIARHHNLMLGVTSPYDDDRYDECSCCCCMVTFVAVLVGVVVGVIVLATEAAVIIIFVEDYHHSHLYSCAPVLSLFLLSSSCSPFELPIVLLLTRPDVARVFISSSSPWSRRPTPP
jgi:hypothetical protein